MSIATWEFESPPLHQKKTFLFAAIAQLVEHNLAKVGVAGPSPVFRSHSLYSICYQWLIMMFLANQKRNEKLTTSLL